MADYKMPYKGRMTIRAGSSEDKRNGRENKRVRAWEFDPKPGTMIAKLELAFLGALSAVDLVIARRDEATKSGRFTADGVASDVLNFALSEAVPVLKRGRNAIASAKQEAAALREKTRLREPETSDQWKVGLMLRAIDRVAAMTQKQRDAFTRNPDNLDSITAEALVTAPASLTGISKASGCAMSALQWIWQAEHHCFGAAPVNLNTDKISRTHKHKYSVFEGKGVSGY